MHTSIHWTYASCLLALQADSRLLLLGASHAPHVRSPCGQAIAPQAELRTG